MHSSDRSLYEYSAYNFGQKSTKNPLISKMILQKQISTRWLIEKNMQHKKVIA